MGGSSTLIIGIVLLFLGTMIAVVNIKSKSREIESSKIVPLPQIGGSALRHGPWPGCLGIEGTKCHDLIESYASDLVGNVDIITPELEESAVDDFDMHRVRLHVDEDGIVLQIPVRGR